jgi:hypothetical protein
MAAAFGNLYDALREAGVNDERARKAAEELFEQTSEVGVMPGSIAQLEPTSRLPRPTSLQQSGTCPI